MKSRAAILFEVGQKLEIREVDVQDPARARCESRWWRAGSVTAIFTS